MKVPTHHALYPLLSAIVAMTALARGAAAGDADAHPRYFAEFSSSGNNGVNFEADGSRRIVAHAGGQNSDVIRFGTPVGPWFPSDFTVRDDDGNVVLDLTGTTWVQVPLLHITESGAEQIRLVYWLVDETVADGQDAPMTGLTAATGPDGDVYRFVSFGVTQIGTSDSYNPGKYRVLTGSSLRFNVSAGLFNK